LLGSEGKQSLRKRQSAIERKQGAGGEEVVQKRMIFKLFK